MMQEQPREPKDIRLRAGQRRFMARTILTSAVALTVCALAVGCGRQAEPPVPESTSQTAASTTVAAAPLEAESELTDSPQNPPKDNTARIRRAIREYIAEKHPGSEVEGVWTVGERGNYCFAGADTVINGRRRNIDVLVRQYVRDDGSLYWRADGWGPEAARMLKAEDAPLGEGNGDEN